VHETGIALDILSSARAAVRARLEEEAELGGRGRLVTVKVAIGELAAVEPELLRLAWEAAVAGGPDAGARLEVRWCPTHRRCPACAAPKDRAEGSWMPLCPDCGAPLQVEGGQELDLESVEFDHEDGEPAPPDAAPHLQRSPRP